ncbi:hypothetical protein EJ03DRAFT_650 [Teratosphaeria nubilosa]|uniref:Heterokaryon incompatibility domain-containing protein n=1 Tax=Teratosphaeria nubilosa TaxID=161662 RepID=A0A6G1LMM8_9PEZI|nr:hypothetical protein EJ03DRAFT_650 [Teratosphaeria nubilosa]
MIFLRLLATWNDLSAFDGGAIPSIPMRTQRNAPHESDQQPGGNVGFRLKVLSLDGVDIDSVVLSYCWGDEEASCSTIVKGHMFSVRPTLHSFLVRLCEQQDTAWMFIDVVCIHQDDYVDKSRQVPLMGDIYRKSGEVLVWLGPALETTSIETSPFSRTLAKKQMPLGLEGRFVGFADQIANLIKGSFFFMDEVGGVMHRHALELAASLNAQHAEHLSSIFNALLDCFSDSVNDYLDIFCFNTYWTRLWIVQRCFFTCKGVLWPTTQSTDALVWCRVSSESTTGHFDCRTLYSRLDRARLFNEHARRSTNKSMVCCCTGADPEFSNTARHIHRGGDLSDSDQEPPQLCWRIAISSLLRVVRRPAGSWTKCFRADARPHPIPQLGKEVESSGHLLEETCFALGYSGILVAL